MFLAKSGLVENRISDISGANTPYPSNYTLEIIQPQPSLTTASRFYKAYPGLEYSMRVGVQWGSFPYTFSLTTAPSGMTIDSSTGKIVWSNPTTSGSPHSVTVSVTDAENTTKTRDWTIAVNTSNYVFIDPNAIAGGAGTLADPLSSIGELYTTSKTDSTWQGYHVYVRDGSQSGGATTNPFDFDAGVLEDSNQKVVFNSSKPQVFMGYPGESPVFDFKYYLQFQGTADAYFYGLTVDAANNTRALCLQYPGVDRLTVSNNTFQNLDQTDSQSLNYSYIFTTRIVEPANYATYQCIQDNTATGGTSQRGYWYIGYSTDNILIENNTVTDCGDHNIGPKESIRYMTIRQNTLSNNAAGGSKETIDYQYSDLGAGSQSGPAEICYNVCLDGCCDMNGAAVAAGDAVYIFRNTFIDNGDELSVGSARQSHSAGTSGPWSWDKNVILNGQTGYNNSRITTASAPETLTVGDNVTGTHASGICDANGLLTGANRTTYLGTHGHEIP